MKIASLCTRRVVTVDGQATLVQAAALMREHHVGALVVTTQAEQGVGVLGVVTDRDLVVEALARGLDPSASRAAELASEALVAVGEEAEAATAVAEMQRAGVRRLLVTDADGRLVGLLSLDDLLRGFADDLASLAGVIRAGIDREVRQMPPLPPLPTNLLRIPAVGTAGWGLSR